MTDHRPYFRAVNRVPPYDAEASALDDLVDQGRHGDADAFARLVKATQPRVHRWALAFARDSDEADDLVQEVFVIALRERLTALVLRYWRELPERQRVVLDLVDLQGHAPMVAAEMLELNPATLRANLFKARQTMRRRLVAQLGENTPWSDR